MYPRAELDEMVQLWLSSNRECERLGDWRPLASLYTEDATYGWNLGPEQEFMVVGRQEIHDIALGQEMGGLDGWRYPYQKVIVDEVAGEVVGFWKQVAEATRPDGTPYEVAGIGGSWFKYAGDMKWSWQRDWFDFGNATALFVEMIQANVLTDGMKRRMDRAASKPEGWYRLGTAPVALWDRP